MAREGRITLRGELVGAVVGAAQDWSGRHSPVGWARGSGGSHVAVAVPATVLGACTQTLASCGVQTSILGGEWGAVFLEDDPVCRDLHMSLVANYIS